MLLLEVRLTLTGITIVGQILEMKIDIQKMRKIAILGKSRARIMYAGVSRESA
jgi:hypothetical protein